MRSKISLIPKNKRTFTTSQFRDSSKCPKCAKCFFKLSSLEEHMLTHDNPQKREQKESWDTRLRGRMIVDDIITTNITIESKYKCLGCEQSFPTYKSLSNHMRVHYV